MAIGKGKHSEKAKKGGKKKSSDPFDKKEWYDVKAPNMFHVTNIGKTCVNPTVGTKLSIDNLKGRVVEANLADLNDDEDQAFRKIYLEIQDVKDKQCLTNFHGMDFTTNKLRSLVRKWHTLIECSADVKTTDGYLLRLFCIGFTKSRNNQIKKTTYAQTSQVRHIRRKMKEVIIREATSCDLKELVSKFIPEKIGKMIERTTNGIYPLRDVFIRKAKMLKTPRFDAFKLMELHTEAAQDKGQTVDREAETSSTTEWGA